MRAWRSGDACWRGAASQAQRRRMQAWRAGVERMPAVALSVLRQWPRAQLGQRDGSTGAWSSASMELGQRDGSVAGAQPALWQPGQRDWQEHGARPAWSSASATALWLELSDGSVAGAPARWQQMSSASAIALWLEPGQRDGSAPLVKDDTFDQDGTFARTALSLGMALSYAVMRVVNCTMVRLPVWLDSTRVSQMWCNC